MNNYKIYCTQVRLHTDIYAKENSIGQPFETIVSAENRIDAEIIFKDIIAADKLCFRTKNGFVAIDLARKEAVEYQGIKVYPHPYQCYKIWKSTCKISRNDLKKDQYRMLAAVEKKAKLHREVIESFDTYDEAKNHFDHLPMEEKDFEGKHPLKQVEFSVYEFNEIKEDEDGLTCDRITRIKHDAILI